MSFTDLMLIQTYMTSWNIKLNIKQNAQAAIFQMGKVNKKKFKKRSSDQN